MLAWKLNAGTVYVAMGTHAKLYVYSAGTLSDITPAGFTAGVATATGSFYSRTEAGTWQLDSFGEDLVGVAHSDGKLYVWDASVGVGTAAAQAAGSPTGCVGVVVTPERFVVALGAGGDRRTLQWPDQATTTVWAPTSENQAGDLTLPGGGQIMAGRRGRGETLIWTDLDLFVLRFIGGEFVYGLTQIDSQCGAISRNSMVMVGGRALWMGARGFYSYDGFVSPIPCEVGDYVFNQVNRAQASKIYADVRSDFNEVWWYYPSGAATENNAYVKFNYVLGTWDFGSIERTSGVDRGFLEYPLAAEPGGAVYEHEKGTTYVDEGDSALVPYVESGPLEYEGGDRTMMVRQYIPDEETLGEVALTLKSRLYPTSTQTTHGPYTSANPTTFRVTAREFVVRFTQVTGGWRVGLARLEVVPGSFR